MKKHNYEDLLRTIRRERDRIGKFQLTCEIPFVCSTFKNFTFVYIKFFDILIKQLELVKSEPLFKFHEHTKRDAWRATQFVCSHHNHLTSPNIPWGLYFFLKDIQEDLKITEPMALQLGTEYLIKNFYDDFPIQQVFPYNSKDVDREFNKIEDEIISKNCKIIEIPWAEIDNPLGYSIMAHECFHEWVPLKEELIKDFNKGIKNDYKEKTEEYLADILSLIYIGPVYALAISKMPDKIGEHIGVQHPSIQARVSYFLAYMELFHNPICAAHPGLKPLLESIHEKVISALNSHDKKQLDGEIEFFTKQFSRAYKLAKKILNKYKVTTYELELQYMGGYFGIDEQNLFNFVKKIQKWLSKCEDNKEIFLAAKPSFFLNILITSENYSQRRMALKEVSLVSFKKWYVSKLWNKSKRYLAE